jgi:hypothetical protein
MNALNSVELGRLATGETSLLDERNTIDAGRYVRHGQFDILINVQSIKNDFLDEDPANIKDVPVIWPSIEKTTRLPVDFMGCSIDIYYYSVIVGIFRQSSFHRPWPMFYNKELPLTPSSIDARPKFITESKLEWKIKSSIFNITGSWNKNSTINGQVIL